MMVDRSAIWAKVGLLRRKFGQTGMPVEQVNRFGRAGDFTLLESSDTAEFVRKCEAGTQEDLVAAIRELIGQATGAGIKVVFGNADAPVAFAIFLRYARVGAISHASPRSFGGTTSHLYRRQPLDGG